MIAITLRGGLGNQLFQWALGMELSSLGRKVLLDARQVANHRGIALEVLKPHFPISSLPSWGLRLGRRFPHRTASGYRLIEEPSFSYWPGALCESLPNRSLLHGYWQSPRYFPTVSAAIRRQVLSAGESALTNSGRDLLDKLRAEQYIAMHVRRGDYASNPTARAFHGLVPMSYYERAVSSMRSAGHQKFAVFSDDQAEAASAAAKFGGETVPHDVGVDPIGELRLMAACTGNILANSSFSWWGAWLRGDGGTVIAPRPWFRDESVSTADLIPSEWVSLTF